MSRHLINVLDTEVHFDCDGDEPILAAMAKTGRKGIPKGCFGGGCGICRIRITEGSHVTGKMSRAHVTEQEEADGYALACKCYPRSDLQVEVVGKIIRALQR
ncbi:MAG: ferredoxin [Gammaproteobacteria bacterium]|nr:MAG: ferredoxin [Gammaproteobacteria bacterium]RLA13137.1 MAG: ferredoxin [Gammaproteobacteria bacterium]RLA17088.1 MAG: ferredoxin [Gammaproteobacteria bacterium]